MVEDALRHRVGVLPVADCERVAALRGGGDLVHGRQVGRLADGDRVERDVTAAQLARCRRRRRRVLCRLAVADEQCHVVDAVPVAVSSVHLPRGRSQARGDVGAVVDVVDRDGVEDVTPRHVHVEREAYGGVRRVRHEGDVRALVAEVETAHDGTH